MMNQNDIGTENFTCPCCGYMVKSGPCGYTPCKICAWEDSPEQLRNPYKALAPNRITLVEAQQNFLNFGVSNLSRAKNKSTPGEGDLKDPAWRPIDKRDSFDPPDDSYPLVLPPEIPYESLYYWLKRSD